MWRKSLAGVSAVLISVTLMTSAGAGPALAAQGPNPYAQATMGIEYDGTGHGTSSQTFITSENGYVPADDAPDDGVVASRDVVGLKARVTIEAGPARSVDVAFALPEQLKYTTALNAQVCVSNQFVTGTFVGTETAPVCRYQVKRGVPVTVETPLRLTAADTNGAATTDQIVEVSVAVSGAEVYASDASRPMTVVSAPAADLTVRPSECAVDSSCSGESLLDTETSGSFEIETWALRKEGYSSEKGASSGTPWQAELDVSSFPAGTTWQAGGETVAPVDGKLPLAGSGNMTVSYAVPESWGGEAFVSGETRDFNVHLLVPETAFATGDYLNNGDGWQPGTSVNRDTSTANERGSGAKRGWRHANNDYTYVRVLKPLDPPPGSIFHKQVTRPWDATQTLYEPGNKTFEAGSEQAVYHGQDTFVDRVDEGTQLRTYLDVNTQNMTAEETPQRVTVADEWDPAQIVATGPVTVTHPDGNRLTSGFTVFWSRTATGAEIADVNVTDGWQESADPLSDARAVRVVFDELPTGETEGAGQYRVMVPQQVADELERPLPTQLADTARVQYGNTEGEAETEFVVPVTPDIWLPTAAITGMTDPEYDLDRTTSTVQYTFTPKAQALASSTAPITGEVTITLDPCLTEVTLDGEAWEIIEFELGSGCGTDNAKPGKLVVQPDGGAFDPSGKVNARAVTLPAVVLNTRVSQLAEPLVVVTADWQMTGQGEVTYTNDEVPFASVSRRIGAEELTTVSAELSTSTPRQEVGDPLKFTATVHGRGEDTSSAATVTVIVLPGKGDDAAFLDTLEEASGNTTYRDDENNPLESDFHGSYTLSGASVRAEDSIKETEIECTTDANPSFDPAQSSWQTDCGPDVTAVKVVQPGGDNAGISTIDIELQPVGDEQDDVYLAWIGPIYLAGESAAMAWPAANEIVASTVSGTVYWDASGKGHNRTDESDGIEEATLDLLDYAGEVLDTTISDEDGAYSFSGLRSREGVTVRVSDTPTEVPSEAIPGRENREVAQTYSYRGKRLTNAQPVSTAFKVPVGGSVEDVDFGFFAEDAYADVKKNAAQVNCPATGTTCDIEWDVTIRNGGNTALTDGMLTDATSTRVYDVNVAGVSQEPKQADAKVAAGGYHSLMLTEAGEVYSFGGGLYGALGHGDTENQLSPKKVEAFDGVSVVQVAAGSSHSLVLTEAGEVYSFGDGWSGQVGHGGREDQLSPKKVEAFDGIPVVQVAAGTSHSLVLTEAGEVYSFGAGPHGELGHGDTEILLSPKKVEAFAGVPVVQVAAGTSHSLVLTESGEVYSFGRGAGGGLGHGTTVNQLVPKKVEAFAGVPVVQVAAGGSHSLVLTEAGEVYSFGSGDEGRLGHGNTTAQFVPKKVEAFAGIPVVQVAAGGSHSLVLTESGEVYSFGYGDQGRLGHGDEEYQVLPVKVVALSSARVVGVSAGGAHSLALTDVGEAYSFGAGVEGRLGHGDDDHQFVPKRIDGFSTSMPREYGGVSPVSVTPRGEFTERVFKVPALQPGEDVTYSVRGKVNRPAHPDGVVVGNQAWYTAAETPRSAPPIEPALPAWDADAPYGAGKWTGNDACTATEDWVTPANGVGGDACDQVYASVAPTTDPLGSLDGVVWEDADADGVMGDAATEPRLPGVQVKLWQGDLGAGALRGETFTDADGGYVFTGLAPGADYYVSFHAGEHPTPGTSWGYTSQADACPTVDQSCADAAGVTGQVPVTADMRTSPVNAGVTAYAADIAVTKGHIDGDGAWLQNFTAEYDTAVPVTVQVQNTGEEAIGMLQFSDATLTGDQVTWQECTFEGDMFTFPDDAVMPVALPDGWQLPVDGAFTCVGALPGITDVDTAHNDLVTVTGAGAVTGAPVTDDSEFTARTTEPDVPEVPVPAVTLEKGVLDGDDLVQRVSVDPTETPTVTFRVTNTGDEDLIDVRLEDTTVTGTKHVTDVECAWPTVEIDGNVHTILYADEADGPVQVDCAGTLEALGGEAAHKNLGEIFALGVESNRLVSDYSEFEARSTAPVPGISLVKSNDRVGENLAVGDEVTYSFVVTNTGNVPLKDVTVSEVEFTGNGEAPVLACPADEVALLAPGAQLVCTATYVLTQADVDRGEVFNSAIASGVPEYPGNPDPEEPIETPPSETVVGSDAEPGIALEKTADRERYTTVGEVVTYTFTVTNTGNVSLADPTVVEQEFNGVSESLTDPECPAVPNPLLPGQQIECTATYTVQGADLERDELVNIAVAEGTPPGAEDPVVSEEDAARIVPVISEDPTDPTDPTDPKDPTDPTDPKRTPGTTVPGDGITTGLSVTGAESAPWLAGGAGVFLLAGVLLMVWTMMGRSRKEVRRG